MNLFEQLREHAVRQPEAIAAHSPRHRITTYKKLWSRIERATARLQQEWDLKPGDVLAYFGRPHPDALVLYFASARCGACLLPLESPELQKHSAFLVQEFKVKILVQEAGMLNAAALSPGMACHELHTLIMNRCPYQPSEVFEGMEQASLLEVDTDHFGTLRSSQHSLGDMMLRMGSQELPIGKINDCLLSRNNLSEIVLPTLSSGAALDFS